MNKNRKTIKMPVRYLMNAVLAALVFVCVGIWLVNKAPAKKEGK